MEESMDYVNSDYVTEECEVPESNDRRWYMVAVVGTPLSLISLFSNLLIAKAVLSRQQNHFFFLGLLALSDSFLSFCYGPVIAMDIIKNRLQWLWLSWIWWSYVGPLLALCHVSMTFSCFLIILNTIERYLITNQSELLIKFRSNRVVAAIGMFLFALIVRGTAFFEIEIVHKENCTGLAEYEPRLTSLVTTWFYGTIFRFYFRNIVTVFIPFFLLAYLNIRIVATLRGQQRTASLFKFQCSEHKRKVRSATRLTVLIVCSYLMANVLNVLITAWEYIDFESAQTEEAFWIYETCADVISVLYVFTCATRLLVYMSCNKEIRNIIISTLRPGRRGSLASNYQAVTSPFQRPRDTSDFDRIAISVARRLTLVDVPLEEIRKLQAQNGVKQSIADDREKSVQEEDEEENVVSYEDDSKNVSDDEKEQRTERYL